MAKQTNNIPMMAQQIVKEKGGRGNVAQLSHCATRLRVNVADPGTVNVDELKKINGVYGVELVGDYLQVIVGAIIEDLYLAVEKLTGVTGAGKKATERTHFCFANENLEAYGVGTHRHTPEIEQILGIPGRLVFTPHLAPLNRGLLSTVNLPLSPSAPRPTTEELAALYRGFYADAPLVEVLDPGAWPRTASVAGTCRAQVGVAVHPTAPMIVAVGAIDNLGKGAAGQAVLFSNLFCGLVDV